MKTHEEDWFPFVRALNALAALANALGGARAPAIHRPGCRSRGTGRADGAYFRVHHFARQLASPFPLLAAVGAKTSRIEIGTAVIDMRYENPLYMAEDACAADLIAGGRLQLARMMRLGPGSRRQ